MTAPGIVLSMLLLPLTAFSQVSITTLGAAGAYSQNFNGTFPGTGDYLLNNNDAGNLGWYSLRTVGGNPVGNGLAASIGNSPSGQFYNYGLAGDADRALGSVAIATTADMFYGLRIQNDTGFTVRFMRVQYTGEQWRAFSLAAQTLGFGYEVSPLDITTLAAGPFTNAPPLNFTTPVNSLAGALNGNLAANRVTLDQTIALTISSGSEIMLRWEDVQEATVFSHGIAIDDVTVTFLLAPTAAPVSISGRATTSSGVGIGGAILTLTGGSLTGPVVARTNPFGYYQFDDVPAGGTYLIEISSKRYSFSPATQVINVQDSVSNVDFVCEGK